MQTHLVLLLLAILAAVCAEVKLEETVIPEEPEEVAPVGGDWDPPGDNPQGTGEEQGTLDQQAEPGPVADRPRNPFARTARRCCKLGRQVASSGLYCNVDFLQVRKRPNVVHRRKMKFHGPEVNGKTAYKDLMRKVEKCALSDVSESIFVKCCEWQEDIMHDLEQCKLLDTLSQRRRCRRRVQARE